MRFEKYKQHIYDKKEKAFLKWREGTDGAGKMEKDGKKDVKTEYCRMCKSVQHQVQLWTKDIEIKCFHKEKEQWGRDKITVSSLKTLMAVVLAGMQMPHKISYSEEETSPRGAAGYRLTFEFKKETPGDLRDKLPVPFLGHGIQQLINLEKEHGPDIGYSEYKIRCTRYRVNVIFLKYSWLHPIAAGHENERYEEVDGFILE